VKPHLRAIDVKHHSLIQAEVEARLVHEPDVETRARKPLRRPTSAGARWELRLGPDNRFRVFYEIALERHAVRVLAIGIKVRDGLFIGGEEVQR
jgi:hypothetical protein